MLVFVYACVLVCVHVRVHIYVHVERLSASRDLISPSANIVVVERRARIPEVHGIRQKTHVSVIRDLHTKRELDRRPTP